MSMVRISHGPHLPPRRWSSRHQLGVTLTAALLLLLALALVALSSA